MIKNIGHLDMTAFYKAMFVVYQWVYKRLEDGYIIAAIDPATKTYRSLTSPDLFPNLARTMEQPSSPEKLELFFAGHDDTVEWQMMPSTNDAVLALAKEQRKAPEDVVDVAVRHYEWCLEQRRLGARTGAKKGFSFTDSPYMH
ncbi:MAG TPA: hypothetical protein VFQ72_03070 [Candidatus Paceibacterota bacterium]|nr:hypothetical protein [Candidatus Paceibacterota bacterium]